jgi:hypothetical protein
MATITITLEDTLPQEGETAGINLKLALDATDEEKLTATNAIVLGVHLADIARFGNLDLDKNEVLERNIKHLVENGLLPAPGVLR